MMMTWCDDVLMMLMESDEGGGGDSVVFLVNVRCVCVNVDGSSIRAIPTLRLYCCCCLLCLLPFACSSLLRIFISAAHYHAMLRLLVACVHCVFRHGNGMFLPLISSSCNCCFCMIFYHFMKGKHSGWSELSPKKTPKWRFDSFIYIFFFFPKSNRKGSNTPTRLAITNNRSSEYR